MSNAEFSENYNRYVQQLVDSAERHSPQSFNEESQRLLGEFFSRDVEAELISMSFLVPRKQAPHWNQNRLVIPEALYSIKEHEPPVYRRRANVHETRVRPLVNLSMLPARDGNNLVAYWYSYESTPNAVMLPSSQPARILTATRLI